MKENNIEFEKALRSIAYGDGSYLKETDLSSFSSYYRKNLKRSSFCTILLPGIGFVCFSLLILLILFLKQVSGNLFVSFVSYSVFNFLLGVFLLVQYGCLKVRAVRIKAGSGFRFVNINKKRQDAADQILKDCAEGASLKTF